ncbi:hypothetical protein [Streptomyces sp. NPDC048659]|uniref:hypothetical protein n=1 Tax=Streptomyces sp. NPDC048659 TaxID=3155489 RepID=UPI0034417D7B
MDKRYGTAALLAAAITVAGCGQAPAAPAASGTPAAPTTATTTTPGAPATPGTTTAPGTATTSATPAPPTEHPAPQDALVEVTVTGGFAGVDNRLVVREDGTYTTSRRGKPDESGRMTPAGLAGLRAALDDPAYARVPDRPSGAPVADGFQYTVTHTGRTVTAGDRERPAALDRVFGALPGGGPPTGR